MLDDDPIFALVRESRPVAPPNLARDVLNRLDADAARAKRRLLPAIVGAVLAAAVLIFMVLPSAKHAETTQDATVAMIAPGDAWGTVVANVDAGEGQGFITSDAGIPIILDAALPPLSLWNDLPTLWSRIDRTAIDACKPPNGMITMNVALQKDGKSHAVYPLYGVGGRGPTKLEMCLALAVGRLELPPLPQDMPSIQLGMPIPDEAIDFADWANPLATIHAALDSDELAACTHSAVTIVIDKGKTKPRVWAHDYVLKAFKPAQVACIKRVLGKVTLPQLPKVIGEIQVRITGS